MTVVTVKYGLFLKAVVDGFELSLSFRECLLDHLDTELPINRPDELVVECLRIRPKLPRLIGQRDDRRSTKTYGEWPESGTVKHLPNFYR
jgi:hypothetical protein